MTVLKGTLKTAIVPSAVAQTVTLMVNNVATPVTGVIVPGMPGGLGYNAGDPFVIIKSGSAPFMSNFTTLSVVADVGASYMPSMSRRTLAMSNTGALTNSLGVPVTSYGGTSLALLYPACTSSGFTFNNGVEVYLSAFPAAYSIAWPTVTTNTTAVVNFRGDEFAPYYFAFNARGPKSNLIAGGVGTNKALNIFSTIDAPSNTFQSVQLYISQLYTL